MCYNAGRVTEARRQATGGRAQSLLRCTDIHQISVAGPAYDGPNKRVGDTGGLGVGGCQDGAQPVSDVRTREGDAV